MAVADTAGSLDSEMSGYRTHAHTDAHRHTHAHAHTTQRDMIAAASPICTDSMCMCLCVDPRSFVATNIDKGCVLCVCLSVSISMDKGRVDG